MKPPTTDVVPSDRRHSREHRKFRVQVSHSRSRQLLSLPMISNSNQNVSHSQSPMDSGGESSPVPLTYRRGFKLPHSRTRQTYTFNMQRIASSVLLAAAFVSILVFLTFPQFIVVPLPNFLHPADQGQRNSEVRIMNASNSEISSDVLNQDGTQIEITLSGGGNLSIEKGEGMNTRLYNTENSSVLHVSTEYNRSNESKFGHVDQNMTSTSNKSSEKEAAFGSSNVHTIGDGTVSAQGVENNSVAFESSDQTDQMKGQSNTGEVNATTEADGIINLNNGSYFVKDEYSDPTDLSTFTRNTALNYFHLHKTGGVSFKERLFQFFYAKGRLKQNGERVLMVDTCYLSQTRRPEMGLEAEWSCDWAKFEEMSVEERQKIDVVLGHQYWEHGARFWIPNRDMRYFTVMRHPLHRKISFFYHFFVRNTGRSENTVAADEVIAFVLGRSLPKSTLVRDAGPGYYASRLCSDGWSGFGEQHSFESANIDADKLVVQSIKRLRRNFLFVGLQSQERASLCMLRKTVLEFSRAHNIEYLDGLDDIAIPKERMNTGGYALTASKLWNQMSDSERNTFKYIERVDLEIYRECQKMFNEVVRKFGCEDLIEEHDEDFIALS